MRLLTGASVSLCWSKRWTDPCKQDIWRFFRTWWLSQILTFDSLHLSTTICLSAMSKQSQASCGPSMDCQPASKRSCQSCDDLSGNIQLPNHTRSKENHVLTEKQAANGTSFSLIDLQLILGYRSSLQGCGDCSTEKAASLLTKE